MNRNSLRLHFPSRQNANVDETSKKNAVAVVKISLKIRKSALQPSREVLTVASVFSRFRFAASGCRISATFVTKCASCTNFRLNATAPVPVVTSVY